MLLEHKNKQLYWNTNHFTKSLLFPAVVFGYTPLIPQTPHNRSLSARKQNAQQTGTQLIGIKTEKSRLKQLPQPGSTINASIQLKLYSMCV